MLVPLDLLMVNGSVALSMNWVTCGLQCVTQSDRLLLLMTLSKLVDNQKSVRLMRHCCDIPFVLRSGKACLL